MSDDSAAGEHRQLMRHGEDLPRQEDGGGGLDAASGSRWTELIAAAHFGIGWRWSAAGAAARHGAKPTTNTAGRSPLSTGPFPNP
jgi:hypothetical protein